MVIIIHDCKDFYSNFINTYLLLIEPAIIQEGILHLYQRQIICVCSYRGGYP
jgi:hypothetical protein